MIRSVPIQQAALRVELRTLTHKAYCQQYLYDTAEPRAFQVSSQYVGASDIAHAQRA
jgi:hypothetical protein